jgi:hypothetical protein
LEQKLDGVVALLTAASQRPPKQDETPSPVSYFANSSTDRSNNGTPYPVENRSKPVEIPSSFIGHLYIPSDPSPSLQDAFQGYSFAVEEAEALLAAFKTEMVSNFPFVIIPPEMTAQRLHNEKPFLFMNIMAAASYRDMTRQRHLGEDVMKYICDHVVLRGEKSLELLQGILIFLSWFVLDALGSACRS